MLPFYSAGQGAAAGKSMFDLGLRMWETAIASSQVIGKRLPIIDAARTDPLGADHAELALMMTEKLAAFAEAGQVAGRAALAAQADWAAQLGSLAALMLAGGGTARQRDALQRRSARTAARGLASAGDALAPIHKAATGNARRLKRTEVPRARKKRR